MVDLMIEDRGSGKSAVLHDGEILSLGRGAVVCAAARKLIERGRDGGEFLQAWRGSTLCLAGQIRAFAALTVWETATGPKFAPYRIDRRHP
jgi:hypothetical protein